MSYLNSRYEALQIYSKRLIRSGRNSYPYLSIDSFKASVECVVHPLKSLTSANRIRQVGEAKTLFVPSTYLEEFLESFRHRVTAKVIVSGNSDTEFHKPIKLPSSVKLLLLQNSFISDQERIQTLPIGLENYSLGLNGNPKHISYSNLALAKNAILFGPFSLTHRDRQVVSDVVTSNAGAWSYCSSRLSPKAYNHLVAIYKFIACVRGNGVDTHRTWETLYRGRYPLLIDSLWSQSLTSLNLPIYLVQDWNRNTLSDITNLTTLNFHPSELPPLWMPYWIDKIRSYI